MELFEKKKLKTIVQVFKEFGSSVDERHANEAYSQYMTLCEKARNLAKRDIKSHDYLKSYYEENGENYPGCLSDDQKQLCLPLYDFLCTAATVYDLTYIWPTYVFLVEVYSKDKTNPKQQMPHIQHKEDYIPNTLQKVKPFISKEVWKDAKAEYIILIQKHEKMKKDPHMAREKELWITSGDVAAQKFLDNIEFMDRALYITIKEAMQRRVDGSSAAWCQYGSLLHTSQLIKKYEEQSRRKEESDIKVLREKYEEVIRQNELHTHKIEELTTRLSQVAGQKMTDGNPHIADLSDIIRPTKIGEMFSELYDNEWTNLLSTLDKVVQNDEEKISILCQCLKRAYVFCKEQSEKQMHDLRCHNSEILSFAEMSKIEKTNKTEINLRDSSIKLLLDLRKQNGNLPVSNISKMFKSSVELIEYTESDVVEACHQYIDQCVKVCWFMCVQDPPMILVFPEQGETVNTELFKFYLKTGKFVHLCVWPALLLAERESVICKGYVLPINTLDS